MSDRPGRKGKSRNSPPPLDTNPPARSSIRSSTKQSGLRNEDGAWHVLPEFFAPQIGIRELGIATAPHMTCGARDGLLTATPGASVDYAIVAQPLVALADDYDVAGIAFDRLAHRRTAARAARTWPRTAADPFRAGLQGHVAGDRGARGRAAENPANA